METEYTNIYYFSVISAIGGIETFFYQLAKKYQDKDLTIVYKIADPVQLERLQKYVRCIKFTGQQIKCKRAFFNFNTDIIDHVDADDYILVVHGDYETMIKQGQLYKAPDHPKINKYIACSKRAAKGFTAVTGKPCDVCYNPFEPEPKTKVLNLVSATRLSREKGKNRMVQLAEMLDKAGIKYIWTVFTNDTNAINNPNIVYMKPRLDVTNFIANADYLVQLSDNEGYCYSVVEALSMGIPVIVTPCPVFNELGLKDGENCYQVPFDMKNIDINKIVNKPLKFEFKSPQDNWDKMLIDSKSTWQEERDTRYLVEALNTYQDLKIMDGELHKVPEKGFQWSVNTERMKILTGENERKIQFVKIIKKYNINDKDALKL